jgi:hypothetical protein
MIATRPAALAAALALACCGPAAKPAAPHEAPAKNAETLAFDITEGDVANHFYRRGPIAAHVLVSSGTNPRVLFAFPAGNTGAGVWFEPTAARVHFDVQGKLDGVERAARQGAARGRASHRGRAAGRAAPADRRRQASRRARARA